MDEIISDSLTQTEQRSLLFHLLYAMESFDYDVSLNSIVDNFGHGFGVIIPTDSPVFKQAQAVIDERVGLDALIQRLIQNWRLERLGIATKLILRYALWELQNTSTEPAVVINEAIELAQCFAEKDAYKFVNGVLDQFVNPSSE